MKTRLRWLVALNGALLGVLIVQAWTPRAGAQAVAGRARGEYTMVSGRTSMGGPHVVYILDSANQELVALKWDVSKMNMAGIGYRSLQADGKTAEGR